MLFNRRINPRIAAIINEINFYLVNEIDSYSFTYLDYLQITYTRKYILHCIRVFWHFSKDIKVYRLPMTILQCKSSSSYKPHVAKQRLFHNRL